MNLEILFNIFLPDFKNNRLKYYTALLGKNSILKGITGKAGFYRGII